MKKKTVAAIVGITIFVFVAVAVNWKFSLLGNLFSPSADAGAQDPSVEAGAVTQDTYFDNARYSRSQSREEALGLLNEIINDDAVDEDTRKNAYDQVVAYAKITDYRSLSFIDIHKRYLLKFKTVFSFEKTVHKFGTIGAA